MTGCARAGRGETGLPARCFRIKYERDAKKVELCTFAGAPLSVRGAESGALEGV